MVYFPDFLRSINTPMSIALAAYYNWNNDNLMSAYLELLADAKEHAKERGFLIEYRLYHEDDGEMVLVE